jgi:cobalt-zinc-cadmium efflux system membrane fusion protein
MHRFLILIALAALSIGGCAPKEESAPKATPDAAKHGAGGAAAGAAEGAWCAEHRIAEAECPFCDPSLLQTLGFCQGHGVPEALCYQCNPRLVPAFQSVGDWCAGHDRPESQCYLCNPDKDPLKKDAAAKTAETEIGALAPPASPPADRPRSRRPPEVHCSKEDLVVRFTSADIGGQAGIEVVAAERRPLTQTVRCNAHIAYDGRRHAQLASTVHGTVAAVHRDLGEAVRAGDPLVTVTSAELGEAKAAYLEARASLDLAARTQARNEELAQQELLSSRDLLESATALTEARIAASRAAQELQRLGLDAEAVEDLARSEDTSPVFVLSAPFDGVVVERDAAVGEVVDDEHPLIAVADPRAMWAVLDIFESDMPLVAVGQPVVLTVDGLRGETFAGEIGWIASHVDARTRTLQARADVKNPRGALKANQFAEAEVAVRDRTEAVVVPVDSVQWEGCCNVVFVKQSEVLYQPRKVLLGVNTGVLYEVLEGVREGEQVVTQGSFLLKTEILKGSIGAGCCEVDPGA